MPVFRVVTYKVITFPGQFFERGEIRRWICTRKFHPYNCGSPGFSAELEDGILAFQEQRVPVPSGQILCLGIRRGPCRLKGKG